MKHVVLFSGGAASSYVAYLLTQDESIDKKDIVLLHTPTLSECADSEKFRLKVARYLKLPMTVWGRGEDIWDCIDRNSAIPGQFMPFCTQQLKQQMKEQYYKYLKSIGEDWIEYVGYGPEEKSNFHCLKIKYRRMNVKESFKTNGKLSYQVPINH